MALPKNVFKICTRAQIIRSRGHRFIKPLSHLGNNLSSITRVRLRMASTVPFTISYQGNVFDFTAPPSANLAEVITTRFPDIDIATVKLLHKGKSLKLRPARDGGIPVSVIKPKSFLKMVASKKGEVQALHQQSSISADHRSASFEHEERREAQRQAPPPQAPVSAAAQRAFRGFEAWQQPGLSPPPAQALALLHRLASDPGILGVMANYGWSVGCLSELPPAGKVGISPVCLLGANVNAGQEITLRLRTDDLKGFRRYAAIRDTLIHELAHMKFSDHDNNFKELNSKLQREAAAMDWKGAPGARTVAGGGPRAPVAPTLAGVAGGKQRQAGPQNVGGGVKGAAAPLAPSDAREAAAAAALRRAAAVQPASFPVVPSPLSASPEGPSAIPEPPMKVEEAPPAPLPKKGDAVVYRQRDGTWVAAKVVAVDVSVQPPSYGIELDGNYRETEATRLRLVEKSKTPTAAGGVPAVEGAEHRDAKTEALEEKVRKMYE